MPALIVIGGKSPLSRPKTAPIIGGKGGGPEKPAAKTPPPAEKESATEDASNDGDDNGITPGTSEFHNQNTVCATCEYFDPTGNNGVGVCKMGVPEADFSVSSPSSSWCNRYESSSGEEESSEESEGKEEEVEK